VKSKKSAAGTSVCSQDFTPAMLLLASIHVGIQRLRRSDPAHCGQRAVRHLRYLRKLVPLILQLLNPLLQGIFESIAPRFVRLRLWKLARQNMLQLIPDSLLALEQLAKLSVGIEIEQGIASRLAVSNEDARHFAAANMSHPACR